MPHLAPLIWLLMPLLILMITYTHLILMHHLMPPMACQLSAPSSNFSNWSW